MKHTTGGTFDPDAGFMYFLAGGMHFRDGRYPYMLIAVNDLATRTDLDQLERLLDAGVLTMLDSGIFNLAMEHARTHGTTHNDGLRMAPEDIDGFDQLWDRYADIVAKYHDRLWGIVELDQGGLEHKPRIRERIERELGVVPMPVYHPLLDGRAYYDELAQSYDRICYGNLVKAAPPIRTRLIHAAAERARAYPHLWTHLLGVHMDHHMVGHPLKGSCDSSGWTVPIRWSPNWFTYSMGHNLTRYDRAFFPNSSNPEAHWRKVSDMSLNNAEAQRLNFEDMHAERERLDA